MSFKKIVTIVFCLLSLQGNLWATIRMAVIFQSNMVLQRDKQTEIWGFGNAGEKVALVFNDDSYFAVTGKDGKWSIRIPSQRAGGPYQMIFKGPENIIQLDNILFGDVWICGGQSNMGYTLGEMGYSSADTTLRINADIRIFTASIAMDYVPRTDLQGGEWKEASAESIRSFSAVAYFFGKFLTGSLNVPIGLISDNLGSTAIEPWMSAKSLSQFPQFDSYRNDYLSPLKSFKEINQTFEKIKPAWERSDYLKGQGMEQKWYLPETDISDWKTMEIPSWWEDQGLVDFDGAVWFRKEFNLAPDFKGDTLFLLLGQIDDYDIVWINGQKVGEGFGNQNWRNYGVPAKILKREGNVIVVRVFDKSGKGGMHSGDMRDNPILAGKWLYKSDYTIDAKKFQAPHVVNASPFSTPAVLYNGNIAPLTSLAIKGFIWYQGESSGSRAEEYGKLFPALISDWRAAFKQGDVPFLFVQLANFLEEDTVPQDSDWAELREVQAAALKLPRTGMAVSIDIGDAQRIHPKNKMDVGKRLSIAALDVAYNLPVVSRGPTFDYMEIISDTVVIHYMKGTDSLVNFNKYGYLKGFAVAGRDNKFYWARAHVRNNTVVVNAKAVPYPMAVRYAWSYNPGTADLYNRSGLPAAPFRTDSLPFKTAGKVFDYSWR